MKTTLLPAFLLALLPLAVPASAEDAPAAKPAAPATCPVSGEELGAMGKPFAYTYKVEGQPDRTVVLCCKHCVAKFEKNPAKYLDAMPRPMPDHNGAAAKTDEHAEHAH